MKDIKSLIQRARKGGESVLKEVHKVIIGQDEIIRQFLWALFASGHVLIIGVPGLAKTLLIRTLSDVLDLDYSRIQFTPDLMPADIIGADIIEETRKGRSFKFMHGPVFSNIVLGDEINRSPPKTQSALLQAMQEKTVTVGGETYELDLPFFVLATQNPIEQEGTYPLPEAQLDRFMFSVNITYPSFEEEKQIVRSTTARKEVKVNKVMSQKEILAIQKLVYQVPVSDFMVQYAINMVRRSRPDDKLAKKYVKNWVSWGAGPRASQYIILAAKAKALMEGKSTVSRQDIHEVAVPVLRHRIITNFNAEADGITSHSIVERIIKDLKDETSKGK